MEKGSGEVKSLSPHIKKHRQRENALADYMFISMKLLGIACSFIICTLLSKTTVSP